MTNELQSLSEGVVTTDREHQREEAQVPGRAGRKVAVGVTEKLITRQRCGGGVLLAL